MTTKSPKNQKAMNKALKHLKQHNIANDQRDLIENSFEGDDLEDSAAWRRINKKCEDTFDKYLEACSELPKHEVTRIENSEIYNS